MNPYQQAKWYLQTIFKIYSSQEEEVFALFGGYITNLTTSNLKFTSQQPIIQHIYNLPLIRSPTIAYTRLPCEPTSLSNPNALNICGFCVYLKLIGIKLFKQEFYYSFDRFSNISLPLVFLVNKIPDLKNHPIPFWLYPQLPNYPSRSFFNDFWNQSSPGYPVNFFESDVLFRVFYRV